MIARPPRILPVSMIRRATCGIQTPRFAGPNRWIPSAPRCLPSPIATIFASPLSISAWKSVWALTRLTARIPSAFAAWASRWPAGPSGSRASSTVSMVGWMGIPPVCSVIPRSANIWTWPSAVAPPWEPIAGTTNGSAPTERSQSPAARSTAGLSWMPRLPAVIATLMPRRTRSRRGSRACAVAPATSAICGESKRCRTGIIRGKGASKRSPRTASKGPRCRSPGVDGVIALLLSSVDGRGPASALVTGPRPSPSSVRYPLRPWRTGPLHLVDGTITATAQGERDQPRGEQAGGEEERRGEEAATGQVLQPAADVGPDEPAQVAQRVDEAHRGPGQDHRHRPGGGRPERAVVGQCPAHGEADQRDREHRDGGADPDRDHQRDGADRHGEEDVGRVAPRPVRCPGVEPQARHGHHVGDRGDQADLPARPAGDGLHDVRQPDVQAVEADLDEEVDDGEPPAHAVGDDVAHTPVPRRLRRPVGRQ